MPDIFDQFEEAIAKKPEAKPAVDYVKKKALQGAAGLAAMGVEAAAPGTIGATIQAGQNIADVGKQLYEQNVKAALEPLNQAVTGAVNVPGLDIQFKPNIRPMGLLSGQMPQPTADVTYMTQPTPDTTIKAGTTVSPTYGLMRPQVGLMVNNPFGMGGQFEAKAQSETNRFPSLDQIFLSAKYNFRF